MTRFYTGRGDEGYTDLLGSRVPKYDARTELIGTLDESTSQLGVARAASATDRARTLLIDIQRDLYLMMAELAFTTDAGRDKYRISEEQLKRIERETDDLASEVELGREFILPGDSQAGAALDVARAVIRRAERQAVRLVHEGGFDNQITLAYLNRLSSLLFILARFEDRAAGVEPLQAKRKSGER